MKRFEWIMAWRETRGAFRHFSLFLLCVALGVAALTGVGSLGADLDSAIRRESKALLASDLELRSRRPLGPEARQNLEGLKERGIETTQALEMIAMASDPARTATQLVELKAVGPGYPFYGKLLTDPPSAAQALRDPASSSEAALVEESLLVRLGLRAGESLRLGEATFRIVGTILKEPDRVAGVFSLGPRLMISEAALPATGLVQTGSMVRYRTLLKLPETEDIEAVQGEVEALLRPEGVRVRSYREGRTGLRRFWENLTAYLAMAGMTALLVGGVGVAVSVSTFLRGKLDTLALLKCLGADRATVLRIYLLQVLLLALGGCLAGVLLGLLAKHVLILALSGFLPSDLAWELSYAPLLSALAVGLLTALLFSLWPLLSVRGVPPARVFRREMFSPHPDRSSGLSRPWGAASAILGGLVLLSLWQAQSLSMGGLFVGILLGCVLLLWLGMGLLIRFLRRAPAGASMVFRYGLSGLSRPGNLSVVGAVSIGIGVSAVLALQMVRFDLLGYLGENTPEQAPGFFFVDIQRDQKAPFEALMRREEKTVEMTPLVRTRLDAVDGRRVGDMDLEGRHDDWYFLREYVVTARRDLPEGNRIVRGQWWGGEEDAGKIYVSVEEDAAGHLGVDLGSSLTFDIQGVPVRAEVASLREVNWSRFSTNFFIIFSPGSLEDAPTTFVASVNAGPDEEVPLQRKVVARFPNVTALNVRHVLETVRQVLERLGLAVQLMAFFCLAAGLVVLAGTVAATRHWRTQEAVILKTLGASRALVGRVFAVEYGVLGAAAGLVGSLMAVLLSYLVLRFLLEIPWHFQPAAVAAGIALTVFMAVLTGFGVTYRILRKKPLAVLRNE